MSHEVLDELNRKHAWFQAKKTGFLWAYKLTERKEVETLEGPVIAEAGSMLCRGVVGELWPQKVVIFPIIHCRSSTKGQSCSPIIFI